MDEVDRWLDDLAERFPRPRDFLARFEKQITARPEDRAELFLGTGCRLFTLARTHLALAVWTKALEYSRAGKDQKRELQCYIDLGLVHDRLGDRKRAAKLQEQALALACSLGDMPLESKCYSNLGCLSLSIGQPEAAIEYHEKALDSARRCHDTALEANCYVNLGNVFFSRGNFARALECHSKARELATLLGDGLLEAKSYSSMGNDYLTMRDFANATKYQTKALEEAQRLGDRTTETACYVNMGNILLQQENSERAVEYYQMALRLARDAGDRPATGQCLVNLGIAYRGAGNVAEAMKSAGEALRIARDTGSRSLEFTSLSLLGQAYYFGGHVELALRFYEQALEISRELRDEWGEKVCLDFLGDAYCTVGDFPAAQQHYEQAAQILEHMRVECIPSEERQSFWRGNVELFDQLVTVDTALGDFAKGLESSERGKGRTIADLMLARGIEQPAWLRSGEMQALADRLQKTILSFRVTQHGTHVFILRPGAALEYVPILGFTARRLEQLVVGNGQPSGWVDGFCRFNRAQSQGRGQPALGHDRETDVRVSAELAALSDTMDRILGALSDELLNPVFSRLHPGDRVILLPNRALNVLPLHAGFREVRGTRRFLIDDFEISYAPNFGLLHQCWQREKKVQGRSSLFAVANPAPSQDIGFSELEVHEISQLFERAEVHFREPAKEELLARAPDYEFVHLASHGVHRLDSSFDSFVRLGEHMDLTLREVLDRLRLNRTWLVCLSACESGLSDHSDVADEFIGLQAGFLHAGAPSVIASLWTVDDLATALLMVKTYENILNEQLSKPAALRKAQLWLRGLTAGELMALLRQKERQLTHAKQPVPGDLWGRFLDVLVRDREDRPFRRPYFWAGFQLFGV
jgi:CHAT domain-containing protein/tetratricopeptide (TPR) repeat protein